MSNSAGAIHHRVLGRLGRGTWALIFALIGGFIAGVMSKVIGVDPLAPILSTYTVVYVLAYIAAVLVDRKAPQPEGE